MMHFNFGKNYNCFHFSVKKGHQNYVPANFLLTKYFQLTVYGGKEGV